MNIAEKVSLVIIIICAVVLFGGGVYSELETALASSGLVSFLLIFLAGGLLNEGKK